MGTVKLFETFTSIQGESSYAGCTCFFIRLAGCNLRCSYCDTKKAYTGGRDVPVSRLISLAKKSKASIVEITGGEPLMQEGFAELVRGLRKNISKDILVETNGSLDISVIPDRVIAVIDVKCPGSGEERSFDKANFKRLRVYDEIKFVISDRKDYEWARKCVINHRLAEKCRAVFFSPVFGKLKAGRLGSWIMKDDLDVRLQVQLHKMINVK